MLTLCLTTLPPVRDHLIHSSTPPTRCTPYPPCIPYARHHVPAFMRLHTRLPQFETAHCPTHPARTNLLTTLYAIVSNTRLPIPFTLYVPYTSMWPHPRVHQHVPACHFHSPPCRPRTTPRRVCPLVCDCVIVPLIHQPANPMPIYRYVDATVTPTCPQPVCSLPRCTTHCPPVRS